MTVIPFISFKDQGQDLKQRDQYENIVTNYENFGFDPLGMFGLLPCNFPFLDYNLELFLLILAVHNLLFLGPLGAQTSLWPSLKRKGQPKKRSKQPHVMFGRYYLIFHYLFFCYKKVLKGQSFVTFQAPLHTINTGAGTNMEPGIRRTNIKSYFRYYPDCRGDINLNGI